MKKTGWLNNLWIILFLITDITFILLIWVIRAEVITKVSLFIFLFSLIITVCGIILQKLHTKSQLNAIQMYLNDQNETTRQGLYNVFNKSSHSIIDQIIDFNLSTQGNLNDSRTKLCSYREYILEWTHELKTPLSLMTLLLENHKNEIGTYVYKRLDYIKHQISMYTEQILFYARLNQKHPDCIFTRFRLDTCVYDIIPDYQPIAEEKNITFDIVMDKSEVVSDIKILKFIISQIISNAVKYTDTVNGRIYINVCDDNNKISLTVRDNGKGVPKEDLPFIFDKGFVGNNAFRQSATGMGLYLADKYSKQIKIDIMTSNILPHGFEVKLIFNKV